MMSDTPLVIARGRASTEPEGKMPWPLTREELARFKGHGLTEVAFEDFMDTETQVCYHKEKSGPGV